MADPGFPVGGRTLIRGGRGPPTWALFGENVCENERIGSHRGRAPGTPPPPPPPDPPMIVLFKPSLVKCLTLYLAYVKCTFKIVQGGFTCYCIRNVPAWF